MLSPTRIASLVLLTFFSLFIAAICHCNIYIYLLFSAVSHLTLLYCINRDSLFFEQFIAILLWLGFWFKVSLSFLIQNNYYNEHSMDQGLVISVISLAALSLARFLRGKYFPINKFIIKNYELDVSKLKYLYIRKRTEILSVYAAFFIIINVCNYHYGIYQRGMQTMFILPIHLNVAVEFMLIFGLGLISSHILFFESYSNKKLPYFAFLIVAIENLFSSISMLSRGMVFGLSSLTYGLFKSIKSKKLNLLFWFFSIFIIIVFFIISLKTVTEIRNDKYHKTIQSASANSNIVESKVIISNVAENELRYLIYNRWVGIEELIMVINKKELSYKLWLNSLEEDGSKKGPSFFDTNFTKRYANSDWSRNNFITTPGVIAFLYYSGSLTFLFISLIFIFSLTSSIELLAIYFSRSNLIFCSFVGQTLAFRLVHFGFAPLNSYKLYGSIIISIFFINFFYRLTLKYSEKI